MEAVQNWLKGKKTYLVGIGWIIAELVKYGDNACTLGTLITTIFGILMGMTVRAGIQKAQDAAEEE